MRSQPAAFSFASASANRGIAVAHRVVDHERGGLIRSPSQPFSSLACFSVWTFSGEPSAVQIAAYFAADFFGRVLRMMPLRISHQTARGISTTRGSDRNSLR